MGSYDLFNSTFLCSLLCSQLPHLKSCQRRILNVAGRKIHHPFSDYLRVYILLCIPFPFQSKKKGRTKSVKGTRQDMSTACREVGQIMLFTLRVIFSSMYEGPAEI